METMEKLLQMHDWFVANQPEGATHPSDCPFCSGEFASLIQEGKSVAKTYEEDEVQALVSSSIAEAVAPLQAELDTLKAGDAEAAMRAKIDEVATTKDAEIAELNAKLDAAVIEATTAKAERDEITGWLQAESDRVVAEAEATARRSDRIAKVAEVIKFPEDHVEARADGWAAQDDEQFEATLADYRVLAASKTDSGLPAFTAMQASRESDTATSAVGSATRELIRARAVGVDVRAVR